MPKRRVLIVDDSVVIRRALTAALSREQGLEVAGSASSGRIALMKIPLLHPDLVALDTDMPGMSGLETLTAIRRTYPGLPVIMLEGRVAGRTVDAADALKLSANDYVLKPHAAVPSDEELKALSDALVSKVAAHFRASYDAPSGILVHAAEEAAVRPAAARRESRIDVLAIGASTGGPDALTDLVPRFPPDFPVPILIVQHMPPVFTKLFSERLATKAQIPVAEGSPGQALTAGQAWMAPGDFHMAVERHGDVVRIVTHQQPAENSCRPAADVLLRSVAAVYGPRALAVVLTGMGQDGLRGCHQIRAAGGQVLVQDEGTSVVWGMPGIVVRAGIADQILPLDKMASEILERVWRHRQSQAAVV